jgi:dTDP-4-dehydrorhamnose 3,5-epimerase
MMRFAETPIPGAFLVDAERKEDDRGFFARAFCIEEFRAHGLDPTVVQANLSFNRARGTLRGLHYQMPPAVERKFFRCIRGATFHVIVDMRPDSEAYLRSFGVELSAENRRGLYVPALCAAGYQALTDEAEVLYFVSEFYSPEHERGLRYDDPALAIEWPLPAAEVSPKDRSWPLVEPLATEARV